MFEFVLSALILCIFRHAFLFLNWKVILCLAKVYVIVDMMSLSRSGKEKIRKKFALHEKDSGSMEVQIALFTEEIKKLAKHLEKHKKDYSSRRGILRIVSKRKRLLDYLARGFPSRHQSLVRNLGLKK